MSFRKVDWSEELETGITAIDLQHRRYFELLNELLDYAIAVKHARLGEERLRESFNFLRNYATEHFGTEEPIMQQWDYPLYPAHRKQHQFFRSRLGQLFDTAQERGYSRELMLNLNYFAVDWFVNHIRTTDRKLAHFLIAKRREKRPLADYLRRLARRIAK